jgi:hypothetical protein
LKPIYNVFEGEAAADFRDLHFAVEDIKEEIGDIIDREGFGEAFFGDSEQVI